MTNLHKEIMAEEPSIIICDAKTSLEVGRFYIENGELHFKGKSHKSAKIFIEELRYIFSGTFTRIEKEASLEVSKSCAETWKKRNRENIKKAYESGVAIGAKRGFEYKGKLDDLISSLTKERKDK